MIKTKIYEVSERIAIWIFHNEPERESIPQKYYKQIVGEVLGNSEDTDFFLGNYFKITRHCEGVNTPELVFIHRSIYEYFVCESLYNAIKESVKDLTDDEQKTLAYNLVPVLKGGTFTKTIEEYLWHKLKKFYNSLDEDKKARLYDWLEDAFSKMLENGILYFADVEREEYKNSIEKEMYYFHNYIGLLRIFFKHTTQKQYIMENENRKDLNKYVSILASSYRCLIGMEDIDFSYLYLLGADLPGANLYEVNLYKVNLYKANLYGAYLYKANLYGADLRRSLLRGANLVDANLEEAQWKDSYYRDTILDYE